MTRTLIMDLPEGEYSRTTVEWRIAEFVRVLNAKEVLRSALRDFQSQYIYSSDAPGPKYTRIVQDTGNQRMVVCFVENATGLVYKSEGWKKPAKGARWDLMDEDDRHLLYNKVDAFGGVFYQGTPEKLRKERDEALA